MIYIGCPSCTSKIGNRAQLHEPVTHGCDQLHMQVLAEVLADSTMAGFERVQVNTIEVFGDTVVHAYFQG